MNIKGLVTNPYFCEIKFVLRTTTEQQRFLIDSSLSI